MRQQRLDSHTHIGDGAALRIDQEVDIRADDGRIVIEPVAGPSYDLDTLLAGMTPETFPDEIDFGRAVGREAW